MKNWHFSERKWAELSLSRRAKKKAEIGRVILSMYTEGADYIKLWDHLKEILSWEQTIVVELDPVWLSDNVYKWAQEAGWHICEYDFNLISGDRQTTLWKTEQWMFYLDNLRSAHNIGSIIRCIEAFCLGRQVFIPDLGVFEKSKVRKTAMGAELFLDVIHCSPAHFLSIAKRPIIAVETTKDAIPLQEWTNIPTEGSLIFGNEETGCRKELLDKADFVVYIPTGGVKRSINVSNAFAIIACHIASALKK